MCARKVILSFNNAFVPTFHQLVNSVLGLLTRIPNMHAAIELSPMLSFLRWINMNDYEHLARSLFNDI